MLEKIKNGSKINNRKIEKCETEVLVCVFSVVLLSTVLFHHQMTFLKAPNTQNYRLSQTFSGFVTKTIRNA